MSQQHSLQKIAIKMLKDNISIEKVAEYTGLSKEEVERLKLSLTRSDDPKTLDNNKIVSTIAGDQELHQQYISEDENIGRAISGYMVEELIAKGGMGSVYRAQNKLGDEVAIKFIKGKILDKDRKRFERECKHQIKVNHENVAKVIEFTFFNDQPAIIMEYVRGETLRSLINREKKLHIARVIKLSIPICEAIAAIHEKGIVHRDIKPKNILLSETGPKLCDFGLAKTNTDTTLTEPGRYPGTLGYIPLECLQGEKLDQRYDIFSFGVVLFEMLIGEKPIKSENLLNYIANSLSKEITIPDKSRENLIEEMETILLKCLEKNPDNRYQNIKSLKKDLQILDYLFDAFLESDNEISISLCSKAIRISNKFAITYSSRAFFYARMNKQKEAIEDYTKAIELQPKKSITYQLRGLAYSLLQQKEKALLDYNKAIELNEVNSKIYYHRGNTFNALEQIEKAIADFTKAIEINPQFLEAYYMRGITSIVLGELDKAIDDLNKTIELNSEYSKAYYSRGIVYKAQQKYTKAIHDFSKAIELNSEYSEAYYSRGEVYKQTEKYEKAINDYSKTIDLDPKYFKAYDSRGLLYMVLQKLNPAISDLNKAIELNPQHLESYVHRGLTYGNLKQYKNALSDFSKVLEVNPSNVNAYVGCGFVYNDMKEYEKAIDNLTKAIELDNSDPDSYNQRGVAYSHQEKYGNAIEDFTKAIAIDPNDPDHWIKRGIIYSTQKNYDKAISDLNKCIKIDSKNAFAYFSLSRAHSQKGNTSVSINYLKKAIDLDFDNWDLLETDKDLSNIRHLPEYKSIIGSCQ